MSTGVAKDGWRSRLEHARVARLATLFTAAAFHNRRLSGLFENAARSGEHAAWADAWDRAAMLVRDARTDSRLAGVADRLDAEALHTPDLAWRIVCRHAASEIRSLDVRTA